MVYVVIVVTLVAVALMVLRRRASSTRLAEINEVVPKRKNAPIGTYEKERLRIVVVGISHENREMIWRRVRNNDVVEIRKEPTNPHDKNALAVHHKEGMLGYIPRNQRKLIKTLNENHAHHAYIYSKQSRELEVLLGFTKEELEAEILD